MKYHKTVYQSLAMVTQFGINMLVPIFLCSFLGWYLDEKLQTSWLFVVLFFMGALAGFRNVFILAKKIASTKDDTREAKRRRTHVAGDEKEENDEED